MTYLQNAWYVAAWSHELGDQPLTRTLLDIPVAMFRDDNGAPFALHDRCPHRFAPLSMGVRDHDTVRCGYHGLSFDKGGTCVHNIFSSAIPKAAKVRAFPMVEKEKAIWIWMGDLEKANPALIPDLGHQDCPDWDCLFGVTLAKADYRLLCDNLMDLTHTAMVHPAFGGLDYIPKVKTWEEGDDVIASFTIEHMPNFTGGEGFVHHVDEIRWISPSIHHLKSCITFDDGNGESMLIPSSHILTPETRSSTHYFWSSATPIEAQIPPDSMMATLLEAFDDQDKPMVEAVQRAMGGADLFDLNPILLSADAGAIRVRRKLEAFILDEKKALEPA